MRHRQDEFSHLPVIILTSSSDAATKLKALDLGASDFLSKPVDPSELALRVRNTLAAKAYQDQLAFNDPLTHLPNSHLFQDRLDWSISSALRDRTKLALLHIAFTDFKRVIDAFGPKVGDEVLKQLALRLTDKISAAETMSRNIAKINSTIEIFRFGSADFALLLPLVAGYRGPAQIRVKRQ